MKLNDVMRKQPTQTASKGFTLVESVIVLVVLAIASIGIASLSGNIFNSEATNKNLQVGMQLMQECAEQVLATRRASGYTAAPSCNTGTFTGFSAPAATLIAETTTGTFAANAACPGGGACGCPTNGSCKLVNISVTTNPGGDNLTPITLLLVGP